MAKACASVVFRTRDATWIRSRRLRAWLPSLADRTHNQGVLSHSPGDGGWRRGRPHQWAGVVTRHELRAIVSLRSRSRQPQTMPRRVPMMRV
jgi:hypothetical protein